MTTKEDVIGPGAHPLYKWLAGELGEDAAPKWNFHKYLIAKDGTIAGVFGSRTTPDDAAMNAEIDKALAR
jgi:glutathione peroxidase